MTINRRAVLSATTMAAVATSASAMAQSRTPAVQPGATSQGNTPAPGSPVERVVTLEEHFLDLPAVEAIAELKQAAAWLPPKIRADLADIGDGRLRDMDDNGITVQVISASMPGAELLDGDAGIRFARGTNDRLAEAVRRHPNRFAGFAHLPMRSPQAAADELERAVTRLGFRGALINGTTEGLFLDNPRFAPILARAAKLDVPIYLHPSLPPKAVDDAYYSGLPEGTGRVLRGPMFGWHAETGMHVLRMVLAGTFEQHPGLNLIIGHMGEMLPFMLDRIDHAAVDMARLPEPPSKILRERVHITTAGVFSDAALTASLMTFGADRILFSIDYPYSSPVIARRWLDKLPVSAADRRKIVHGNADRLLKLNPTV